MRINLRKLKTDKRDGIPTGKVVYVNWLIAHQHSIGYVQINREYSFKLQLRVTILSSFYMDKTEFEELW